MIYLIMFTISSIFTASSFLSPGVRVNDEFPSLPITLRSDLLVPNKVLFISTILGRLLGKAL